jgi:Flp pilus assembly pilin Flp
VALVQLIGAWRRLRALTGRESETGADSIEWALVVGVVVVAIVAALTAVFPGDIVTSAASEVSGLFG